MPWLDPWLMLVPVAGLLVFLAAWWFYHVGRQIQVERARELFRLQRERLEKHFLEAASASAAPRGLRWLGCEFVGDFELARDRHTRRIIALVPVVVRFEAIEGGDMEGLPAVDQPKQATAVFAFERGHWVTAGKLLFNLTPSEAIRHFEGQYERLDAHPHRRDGAGPSGD